jgi:hypothetical protein
MSTIESQVNQQGKMTSIFHRQPDLSLLGWWVLATLAAAAIHSLLYQVLDEWMRLPVLLILSGVPLGVAQGLVLRQYLQGRIGLRWTVGTAISWFIAAFVLLLLMTLAGGGPNDVSATEQGGCALAFCIFSGGLFGFNQAAFSLPAMFKPDLWAGVNAVAWGVGGLAAGTADAILYGSGGKPWYDFIGEPAGLFVGVGVYGLVAGLAVLLTLSSYARAAGL